MYILDKLKITNFMGNDRSLNVTTLDMESIIFSLDNTNDSTCGYIKTDITKLSCIFGNEKINEVITLCEKKFNKNTNSYSHCNFHKNPESKVYNSKQSYGKNFNCKHF